MLLNIPIWCHSLFFGLKKLCHGQANRHWGIFQWSLTSHFMAKTKILVGGYLSFKTFPGVQKGQNVSGKIRFSLFCGILRNLLENDKIANYVLEYILFSKIFS